MVSTMVYSLSMTQWPDQLQQPDPARVQLILAYFWRLLAELPDRVEQDEQLLCHATTTTLRTLVLEMMLALNGIAYPQTTRQIRTTIWAPANARRWRRPCWRQLQMQVPGLVRQWPWSSSTAGMRPSWWRNWP